MDLYDDSQRALHERFDTVDLAAALEAVIVTDAIDDNARAFIESRDFFFLSTVNADGWPTVSYKGGPVGVVRVVDERTIEFPSYDGNGMFLSMGNVDACAKIGMLFIDMETPRRLRVQANATITDRRESLDYFPGAQLVARATIEAVFPNCARYIHHHERIRSSEYVPDTDGAQPFPSWKRVDLLQPVLPAADRARATAAGGTITSDEYQRRLADGTS